MLSLITIMTEDLTQTYPQEFANQVHAKEIKLQTTLSILSSPSLDSKNRVLEIAETLLQAQTRPPQQKQQYPSQSTNS